MSFYGSVYYELVDTFYKVLIHNKNKDGITFPAAADVKDESALLAIGRKGVLDINNGNRWIKFTADPDTTKYTIWHDAPDSENQEDLISFQKVSKIPDDVEAVQLIAGDFIKTSQCSYDAAGHIAEQEDIYYQLPATTVEQDIKFLTETIGDIKEVYPSHGTEPDGEEGDALRAEKTICDAIGDIENLRGKLGEDYADIDISSGLEELYSIANTIGSVKDDIYEEFDYGRTLTSTFGSILSVYPDTYDKEETNLCSAIGNIDNLRLVHENEELTLVDAIMQTAGHADSVNSNLAVTNIAVDALETKAKDLEERLAAIELWIESEKNKDNG